MFTWALHNLFLCALALFIGVATGWWIWARTKVRVLVAPALKEPLIPPDPLPSPVGPRIAPAVGAPDNLELIKGIGPALNALLISLGVRRFDQIAAWGPADIAEVDRHLDAFRGRIERDHWVDQAGFLARGDYLGFEAKYGAVGSEV